MYRKASWTGICGNGQKYNDHGDTVVNFNLLYCHALYNAGFLSWPTGDTACHQDINLLSHHLPNRVFLVLVVVVHALDHFQSSVNLGGRF